MKYVHCCGQLGFVAIVNRPFCFSVDWFLVPRVGTSTKQLHLLKPSRSLVFFIIPFVFNRGNYRQLWGHAET